MTEHPEREHCRACRRVLFPANEDDTWPGLCVHCVQAGTPVLRLLRDPHHHPPASHRREQPQ